MIEAPRGWDSSFEQFAVAPLSNVLEKLRSFLPDAGPEQAGAWRDSIPKLQREAGEVIQVDAKAGRYTAVLEYQLPLEFRRVDAVFLLHDSVVAIELKGRASETDADLDQAQAYARDLRAYHASCERRAVHAVLIPARARGELRQRGEVFVCSPDMLDQLLVRLDIKASSAPIDARSFLSEDAYRPLPTLVRAARELFEFGTLRRVKRAAAATEPATECLLSLAKQAASERRRKLVLLSGVPGAGKTLVGLRLVHSPMLDELAVERVTGRPSSPAVFLSGNGPLVDVLSYELRSAGGGGHTFVRGVKQYVQRHLRGAVPSEHVVVYDEAQRAYDAAMVAEKHGHDPGVAKSEPELFIEFAERIPEWCVIVALIGGGQEIHKGEEAGVRQWADALKASSIGAHWDVHGALHLSDSFYELTYEVHPELNLDKSLRSHLAHDLHRFVQGVVDLGAYALSAALAMEPHAGYAGTGASKPPTILDLPALAAGLARDGHHLRITRRLSTAKEYLRDRYRDDPLARFGLLASSRDRSLSRLAEPISNDFQSTSRVKYGPWYGDGESDSDRSCRHLRECVTEFGAQGLELDGALLAWGTDFVRANGCWSIARAAKYKSGGAPVHNPAQLRANAYRVLLTRARDVTVVFIPPLPELDETYTFLCDAGFEKLTEVA